MNSGIMHIAEGERLRDFGLHSFFLQQLALEELEGNGLARVTAVQRSLISVICADGERGVSLAPLLQRSAPEARPTVGDWVMLNTGRDSVNRVLERKSLFKRAAAGKGDAIQPIAANVDTVFIVSSCNEEFNESRLERYLALCRESGAFPVLVLTKADLVDNAREFVGRAATVQGDLAVESVNAKDAAALDGVRRWIDPRATVALLGSSGVGKSTLLNALAGRDVAATQGIRERDKKGRHTTSHRALYRLPGGGLIIDVPGMRELRVADVEEALGEVFDDIEERALRCKFADCEHDSEPGCAVKAALADGSLDARRLASYQKLRRENVRASATIAERRATEKNFARRVEEAKWAKRRQGSDE